MGWLFKRERSKYWYARWYVDGKERIISTQCTDLAQAKAALARLEGGISALDIILNDLNKALDELPEQDRDQKIESLIQALNTRKSTKLRIVEGWRTWEMNPNKKRTPKFKTLEGYRAIWKRFEKWAKKHRIDFFHGVNRALARDYAQDLW